MAWSTEEKIFAGLAVLTLPVTGPFIGGALAGIGTATGLGTLGTLGTGIASAGTALGSAVGVGGTATAAVNLGVSAGGAVATAVSAKVTEELHKPGTYTHLLHGFKHLI